MISTLSPGPSAPRTPSIPDRSSSASWEKSGLPAPTFPSSHRMPAVVSFPICTMSGSTPADRICPITSSV